ncbi:MAG: sigma-54-dependent Fis family transcriptional regulator, partial [Nitrospira sp.]|nr:sigma-54-dependent Fis family transcriptional regulator [Nitrospira sp.]
RPGRFELAHGGTLFLDEIGEMPLEAQVKLLRVLEDGEIDRVGGTRTVPVDVRIVAATNADLLSAIGAGRFRSDLYYRLCVFPLALPSLRERPDDIPLLARHFLDHYRLKLNRPCLELSDRTIERLVRYSWPGNVRELQNLIERGVILARSTVVEIDDQFLTPPTPPLPAAPSLHLQELERAHIARVLERTHWRIYGRSGAAAQLGLNPSTLRSRMKKLGIRRAAE